MKKSELIACAVGILVGAAATWYVLPQAHHHSLDGLHPNANPNDDEYHVHADFHIVINDELLDLSTDRYMTSATQTLHPDTHLHDGEGDVKHIHAEGVTFVDFLSSLGIELTADCIELTEASYCSDTQNELSLFIDHERYTGDITTYIPQDDERILLYYGQADNPKLTNYLEAVPNDACIYSGTCPERGTAPPESCGLTCEL